ncbi:unnamed protein product [Microthlaspi erraticum]|uniref:Metal transporter Nramp2 n=1 Tax=Microthlaspi erraticum TaxID=1685480 RepID=A0A6D2LIN5_9BRAS|nr:unnamed protein product [Microthlaspi erraticum]
MTGSPVSRQENSPKRPNDSNGEFKSLLLPETSQSDSDEGLESPADQPDNQVLTVEEDGESTLDSVPPFSWAKLWKFTGPGFLMSIGFLDPGNIEGDLQSGAVAGYSLLWLLLWATLMGLLIQLLSARLGVATGRHLAEICRNEYPSWARILLWFMAEVALIGADIQEVIGSAIALRILTRGFLPIWVGVIITSFDCFLISYLEKCGMRKLEGLFAGLIATMALSFAWMFNETKPSVEELFIGILVPKIGSKTIRQAVGVVGCVITPHNVFLHSALVQSRKTNPKEVNRVQEALNYYNIESTAALFVSFMINLFVTAVFAKGFYGTNQAESIGLVNAGHYLQEKYGGGVFPILYIWGIGLLAAGQSSTITGTYAGQFIMEGFLDLQVEQWLSAFITRSFAIVPTMLVAVMFNRTGSLDVLNEWLNILQSMQIPFAVIPLLTMVSKEHIMGVFKIGPFLEKLAWTVAVFVMTINGYLLLDFFMAEVRGFFVGFLVFGGIIAYISFIIYLVSYRSSQSSSWTSLEMSQRVVSTET